MQSQWQHQCTTKAATCIVPFDRKKYVVDMQRAEETELVENAELYAKNSEYN